MGPIFINRRKKTFQKHLNKTLNKKVNNSDLIFQAKSGIFSFSVVMVVVVVWGGGGGGAGGVWGKKSKLLRMA